MFRQMDLKGQTQADARLKTTHQNTISTVRVYEQTDGVVHKFSSKIILPSRRGSLANAPNHSEWSRWACCHLVDLNGVIVHRSMRRKTLNTDLNALVIFQEGIPEDGLSVRNIFIGISISSQIQLRDCKSSSTLHVPFYPLNFSPPFYPPL